MILAIWLLLREIKDNFCTEIIDLLTSLSKIFKLSHYQKTQIHYKSWKFAIKSEVNRILIFSFWSSKIWPQALKWIFSHTIIGMTIFGPNNKIVLCQWSENGQKVKIFTWIVPVIGLYFCRVCGWWPCISKSRKQNL